MKRVWNNRYWQVVILFMIIKLGLHFITNTHYELHRDEMLYFNQADHLGLGNATVPPFIGWVAYLIKSIFGYSVFGIRLFPAMLGSFSILIMAMIIRDLGGQMMALVLACSAYILSPGFLIFGSLFTVNVFDQFFWLLISYLFFRMMLRRNPKLWILIGIISGIAFLNKYLVLYLLAGFFLGMLLTPQRKLIFNRYFALAVLIGLLIISPNIYWQYSHGWPIIFHIRELEKSQMANMRYGNFLVDLFDLHYVTTFFWLTGFFGVLMLKREKPYRYLGIVTIIVILLFIVSKGKAYYTLGIFPLLFVFSGYLLEKYLTKKRILINYFILVLIIGFSSLTVPLSLPLLSFEKLSRYTAKTSAFVSYPFSRWEDGQIHPISQIFSDMTGWEELTSLVNQAYRQLPENEKDVCTIYAERNYGYAGAVHFYGKPYGLPEAITFLDSYTLWAPDTIPRGPMIYIYYELAGLDKLFEKCLEAGTVHNPYFRENGLKVFLCQNPDDSIQQVYKQKAAEEKAVYH